jgi:hypothetical protein
MTLFATHARPLAGRRFVALVALICAALFAIAGLSSVQAQAEDQKTRLVIHNDGGEALKCVILFGHWVTLDIAEVAPAKAVTVEIMRQAKDGGLYVPRFDGRHMMVERIACGRASQMWESSGDIPLLGLRATLVPASESHCTLNVHVVCTVPEKSPEVQGGLWRRERGIGMDDPLPTVAVLVALTGGWVA